MSIFSFFRDTKAEIGQLLEQISAGWVTSDVKAIVSELSHYDPHKIYPITITFKKHDWRLNEELYLQILSALQTIHKDCYYLLYPAYQNSYVLHFHGVIITHPTKGVGLTFVKRLRAMLNKNLGWCKITNLKRDNKSKVFNPKMAIEQVFAYALSEDNYGGCDEYRPISNLPSPEIPSQEGEGDRELLGFP